MIKTTIVSKKKQFLTKKVSKNLVIIDFFDCVKGIASFFQP